MSGGDMAKPLLGHRSTEGDPSVVPAAGRTIGVLGSGDFARSLAIRLVCSGFKVVVGSRNPKRKACLFPPAAEVTFQAEAVKKTDVIFVAVFREHYSTLCDLADVLAGKILVDVSNNTEINHHKESNAEYLASLFPACTVVKGFNVVSAWTLQSGARDGNKQSTLGFIALVISTLHTLTYGWSRAFDENQYKFYLPPTYTLTLLVPCTVILAKVAFSLPCIQHRLLRIRRGWEKGRYVKFVLPSATGEYSSGETSSNV